MTEKKEKKVTKTIAEKEKVKKATTKKAVAKKPATKKPVAKKTTTTKASVKKIDEAKKSIQDYIDLINWKKWEAHHMNWLYIEVNAGDLLAECEMEVDNLKTCCKAILDCMLEGDAYVVEPKVKTKIANSLTVRYYVDNLSADRKKY